MIEPTIASIIAGSIGMFGYLIRKQFTKIDKLSEKKANKTDVKELIDTKMEVLRLQDKEIKEDIREIKLDIRDIKTSVEKIREKR